MVIPGDEPNVIQHKDGSIHKNNKMMIFRDPKMNLAQLKKMYMDETGRRILFGIIKSQNEEEESHNDNSTSDENLDLDSGSDSSICSINIDAKDDIKD